MFIFLSKKKKKIIIKNLATYQNELGSLESVFVAGVSVPSA